MALTWIKLGIRTLKTIFFATILWMLAQPKIYRLHFSVQDENPTLMQWLKSLSLSFLYLTLLAGTTSLLVAEFVEEPDDELKNTERYSVNERKLCSGYLKENATQTPSNYAFPTTRLTDAAIRCAAATTGNTNFDQFRVWRDVTRRKTLSSPGPFNVSSVSLEGTGLGFLGWEKFLVPPGSCMGTFDDLIGIDNLKQALNQYVLSPLASASTNPSGNVPRGIMLLGSQGTGKSSIAQALVNRLRIMMPNTPVNFYKVDCCNCFGPFIDAGITFHDLFLEAGKNGSNNSKSVVLFDNIDHLYHRSVRNFLSELGSIPSGSLLVIATARKRDQLHDQLQMNGPGKFDYIFEIEFPDYKDRLNMLMTFLTKRGCVMDELHVSELAGYTYTFNCGELENLAELISINAGQKQYRSANLNKKRRQCFDGQDSAQVQDSSYTETKQVGRMDLLSAFETYKKQRVHPKLRFTTADVEEKKTDEADAAISRNDSATVAENHGRLKKKVELDKC